MHKFSYLATVFLRWLLNSFDIFFKVTGFFTEEKQQVALDISTEDLLRRILVEFDNQR